MFFAGTQCREDWIEQCFTSAPTQYRLYGKRFLQVKRPNQQYQVLKVHIVHRQIKHTIIRLLERVCYEAVRSAILATAWLLVLWWFNNQV